MMVLSTVTMLALAAAPVSLAAPGFSALGLDQKAGDFYSDQVSQQLGFRGLKVITRTEVNAMLGNERQRQLLGCSDESSSCTTELAGALGADALLLGDVAKTGDKYRLSVRIIGAKTGARLSSAVVTGSSEDALLEAFSTVSERMAAETTAKVRNLAPPAEAVGVSRERTGTKRFFWIPAAAGAVGLVGGAFAWTQAKSRYDTLRSGQALQEPVPSRLRNEGQSYQTLSAAGFGLAAAGIATAAGLYLWGSETVIEAGVALSPGGGTALFAGAF